MLLSPVVNVRCKKSYILDKVNLYVNIIVCEKYFFIRQNQASALSRIFWNRCHQNKLKKLLGYYR